MHVAAPVAAKVSERPRAPRGRPPRGRMVRVVSWNVNGIRTLQPTLKAALDALDADIICLQETKISPNDLELERLALVPGYHSFFSFCTLRTGYSGTATFTRVPEEAGRRCVTPVDAGEGFDNAVGGAVVDWGAARDASDAARGASDAARGAPDAACVSGASLSADDLSQIGAEGRVVVTDHAHFVLINIYAPAVTVDGRQAFKASFNRALELKVRALRAAGRRVMVAGDFNISPATADVAETVRDVAEFSSRPSRAWLRDVMLGELALVDTFRAMNPSAVGAYTCWSEATRARETNFGARIDLIVADANFFRLDVTACALLPEVYGSDHCPVSVDLRDDPFLRATAVSPPPFCAKFLKRFTAKQASIRAFLRQPSPAPPPSARPPSAAPAKRPWAATQGAGPKEHRRRRRPKVEQLQIGMFFQPATSSPSAPAPAPLPVAPIPSRAGPAGAAPAASPPPESPLQAAPDSASRAAATADASAANEWRQLLPGPPPPPLCRHREPCTLKGVKKAGENKGRTFYACSRPKGEWPSDRNASCNFFSWAPYRAGQLMPKH
jgi:AP endonuclease 2